MQLDIGRLHHTSRIQMKRTLKVSVSFLIVVQIAVSALTSLTFAQNVDATEIGKRLEASTNVLDQIMSSPEMTIPSQVLAKAKCVTSSAVHTVRDLQPRPMSKIVRHRRSALDWNHARGYLRRLLVFQTGEFCSCSPRPFHPLGSIRSFPRMVPTGSPVAAHRFSRLGNSY